MNRKNGIFSHKRGEDGVDSHKEGKTLDERPTKTLIQEGRKAIGKGDLSSFNK